MDIYFYVQILFLYNLIYISMVLFESAVTHGGIVRKSVTRWIQSSGSVYLNWTYIFLQYISLKINCIILFIPLVGVKIIFIFIPINWILLKALKELLFGRCENMIKLKRKCFGIESHHHLNFISIINQFPITISRI